MGIGGSPTIWYSFLLPYLLASQGTIGKDMNSVTCLRNAGSYYVVTCCASLIYSGEVASYHYHPVAPVDTCQSAVNFLTGFFRSPWSAVWLKGWRSMVEDAAMYATVIPLSTCNKLYPSSPSTTPQHVLSDRHNHHHLGSNSFSSSSSSCCCCNYFS